MFHKLDKNGYEEEMKRHDEAMERLNRDKEKWYEKTVEKKNKLALLRQELNDANKDLDATNDALHAYRKAMEDLDDYEKTEPTLGNYYQPSDEMKMYMNVVTGVVGSVSGVVVVKLLF